MSEYYLGFMRGYIGIGRDMLGLRDWQVSQQCLGSVSPAIATVGC